MEDSRLVVHYYNKSKLVIIMNQATTYFPTHLRAVSSALKDLTSGFGMVPGVAPSVLPPEFKEHSNNRNIFVNMVWEKLIRSLTYVRDDKEMEKHLFIYLQEIAAPSARDDFKSY